MIEKYLDINNLIITPNCYKKKVIKEINSLDYLVSYKVMDIKEFLNKFFFSYDKKTINYIVNNYNLTVSTAIEYLNNLYYLEDREYNFPKLNELNKIKKDLIDNNLLYFNNNFKYYLENTKIIIYNYDLDPFYLNILEKYNYTIINNISTKKDISVLEFNTIEDEVSYVANDILDKINNNIDINSIKLIDVTQEYILPLKRVFTWFNIPLTISNNISLYDLEIGKLALKLLKNGNSYQEVINNLKTDENEDIINKLINIFNTYVDIDNISLELVKYDLKNTYLKEEKLLNSIKLVSFGEIDCDDHIYLLGFNKENYPIIHKDDDLLSDNMKKELGLFTSNEKNILEKENIIRNIYNTNNLTITYKLKDSFDNYNPSTIILDKDIDVIKDTTISYNKSNFFNKIKLASLYDNYNKYGVLSDDIKLLKENYNDLEYDTYSNNFNSFKMDNINYLNLSYSQIDEYYKCPFSYYLKRILKIKDLSNDDFAFDIGNIFHHVLEHYKDKDFSFDKLWNEKVSINTYSNDKLLILDKLKEELKFALEIIKEQEKYYNFDKYLFEKEINVDIKNNKNIKINFTGKVDKIIYKQEDDTITASLIDYKTGNNKIDLNNVIYGLDMQLPIYMYLLKRSNLAKKYNIAGFYLQHLVNRDIKATYNESSIDLKKKEIKLDGYSNDAKDIISNFDNTYENSEYIKGLKTTKSGSFDSRSKTLNNSQLEKLDSLIETKIEEAANNILDAKFNIEPKKIDKTDISCIYCPYKDICFKHPDKYEYKKKQNLKDFLGGDN